MNKSLKRPLTFALLAALPIELANFFLFHAPIDVGPAPDASLLEKFMINQWVLIHLPGMWFSDWASPDSVPDPSNHLVLIYSTWISSGYIDTVLLILLGCFAFRGIRRLTQRAV
jgi:hypothetical protein